MIRPKNISAEHRGPHPSSHSLSDQIQKALKRHGKLSAKRIVDNLA